MKQKVEVITLKKFSINLDEEKTEEFIDELDNLCEKFAVEGSEYYFTFKGE